MSDSMPESHSKRGATSRPKITDLIVHDPDRGGHKPLAGVPRGAREGRTTGETQAVAASERAEAFFEIAVAKYDAATETWVRP